MAVQVAVHKLECTHHNFITWTTSISSKNHVQLMHKFRLLEAKNVKNHVQFMQKWRSRSRSINWNAHITILSRGLRLFRRRITCSSCITGAPSNQNRACDRNVSCPCLLLSFCQTQHKIELVYNQTGVTVSQRQ